MTEANPFTHSIRVPYRGTDASGILHFAEMPHYFELAEHEFFREIGCPKVDLKPLDFPRVSVECDYLAPVYYDDLLAVELWVDRLGSSSLTYRFRVRRDDTEISEGSMTVVCVDAEGKSTPLPDWVRERIEAYFDGGDGRDEAEING